MPSSPICTVTSFVAGMGVAMELPARGSRKRRIKKEKGEEERASGEGREREKEKLTLVRWRTHVNHGGGR